MAVAPGALLSRAATTVWPSGPGAQPVPYRRWHGESSVGAALRAGTIDPGSPLAAVQASLAPISPVLDELDQRMPSPVDQDNRDPRLTRRRETTATPVERLRARFPRLRRHFAFEYYAWYRTSPYRHWDDGGHTPPDSIASATVPALGAYDSAHAAIIEQHARWMAEAGVGAIALSWWGRNHPDNLLTPLIMDVMRAHDIHVTFHLEPYANDRVHSYASDILYILQEYGEKRRWDNFLLLDQADGTSAPVFKSFRTILPPTIVDCHGIVRSVPDFASDGDWRRQTDQIRDTTRSTFDRLILLADSLDAGRTVAGGFDGIAIYDSYVRPTTWQGAAEVMGGRDLVSSFSINCGFDGFHPVVPRYDCDIPLPFEPPVADVNWADDVSRAAAEAASRTRVFESLSETLRVQATPLSQNAREGFFLAYVNTFNEWHEGTSFEPALDRAALTPAQRARGYHNPADGSWRLDTLRTLLAPIIDGR